MSALIKFNLHPYSGKKILEIIDELAALRIEVFREYPYLYEGSLEYEKKYLQIYVQSERSCIWMLETEGKIVGATTCIPLADESDEFKKDFVQQGYSVDRVFYFGESIIKKDYRGSKVGPKLFKLREEHAKSTIPDLEYTCFAAIERGDHPMRPEGYRPLDSFWNRLGYQRNDKMKVHYPWRDIGESEETKKTLYYWMKKW